MKLNINIQPRLFLEKAMRLCRIALVYDLSILVIVNIIQMIIMNKTYMFVEHILFISIWYVMYFIYDDVSD